MLSSDVLNSGPYKTSATLKLRVEALDPPEGMKPDLQSSGFYIRLGFSLAPQDETIEFLPESRETWMEFHGLS